MDHLDMKINNRQIAGTVLVLGTVFTLGLHFSNLFDTAEPPQYGAGVKIKSGDSPRVTLTWDYSPDDTISWYKVFVNGTTEARTSIVGRDPKNPVQVTFDNLNEDETYTAYAFAIDKWGVSSTGSNVVSFNPTRPSISDSSHILVYGDGGRLQRSIDLQTWTNVDSPYTSDHKATKKEFFRVEYP